MLLYTFIFLIYFLVFALCLHAKYIQCIDMPKHVLTIMPNIFCPCTFCYSHRMTQIWTDVALKQWIPIKEQDYSFKVLGWCRIKIFAP